MLTSNRRYSWHMDIVDPQEPKRRYERYWSIHIILQLSIGSLVQNHFRGWISCVYIYIYIHMHIKYVSVHTYITLHYITLHLQINKYIYTYIYIYIWSRVSYSLRSRFPLYGMGRYHPHSPHPPTHPPEGIHRHTQIQIHVRTVYIYIYTYE